VRVVGVGVADKAAVAKLVETGTVTRVRKIVQTTFAWDKDSPQQADIHRGSGYFALEVRTVAHEAPRGLVTCFRPIWSPASNFRCLGRMWSRKVDEHLEAEIALRQPAPEQSLPR